MREALKVAVVDGVRTPFVKRESEFRDRDALDLGEACVAELVQRSPLGSSEYESLIFGRVLPSMREHNIAREIGLALSLPAELDAHTVSQACVTSYRAALEGARAIRGGAKSVIVGGAESASATPIALSDELSRRLKATESASGAAEALSAWKGTGPSEWKPRPPAYPELATGLSMGQSAEKMARLGGISRVAQDDFAHRSHVLAGQAWRQGRFEDEVVPLRSADGDWVCEDGTVRFESDREKYRELGPAFEKPDGTITPGNSSPLSDGAAALLLMDSDEAERREIDVLGHVSHWAFGGVDPRKQLLIGPAVIVPELLEFAGVGVDELDLVDMHEAFAAQTLAVLRRLEEHGIRCDSEQFNVNGGSIALGHPFAATGARQITQTLRELRRRGGGRALVSACAGGGLAAAVLVEAPSGERT